MNACWLSTFVILFFLNVARQTEVSKLHALRRSHQDVSHRNVSAAKPSKGNQKLTQLEVEMKPRYCQKKNANVSVLSRLQRMIFFFPVTCAPRWDPPGRPELYRFADSMLLTLLWSVCTAAPPDISPAVGKTKVSDRVIVLWSHVSSFSQCPWLRHHKISVRGNLFHISE